MVFVYSANAKANTSGNKSVLLLQSVFFFNFNKSYIIFFIDLTRIAHNRYPWKKGIEFII